MPTTPTIETMLKAIRQSGLIDAELLRQRMDQFREDGTETEDPAALVEKLVEIGDLTKWQADKIKQGKNKGFFLGKYRLLSLLGRGGMSSVYLAEHVLMRRRCAIKVLPVKKVDESSYLGRFHREAQAVAALDHPNIVRAYDIDSDDGHGTTIHFLVMEYVDGRNLQLIVDEDGPCEFEKSIDYIRQAAEGLAHAHEAGFVHRDIKPGNLLVDSKGVVKLLDLGLARYFNNQDETSLTIEHNEKVLGTADYLAPEQALNSHTVDSRADIYGLGCTLYFLLTGKPPFDKGTLAQKLLAHQTEQPPSILENRSDTPSSIQAVLEKMMAKKADDRYQTAKELADELSDWLVDNGHDEMLDSRLQRRANDSSKSNKAKESSSSAVVDAVAGEVSETPVEVDASNASVAPPEDVPPPQVDEGLGAFLAGLDAPSPPAPKTDVDFDTSKVTDKQVEEENPNSSDEEPKSGVPEIESPVEPEPESPPTTTDQHEVKTKAKEEAAPNFDFLHTEQAPPEAPFTPPIEVEETTPVKVIDTPKPSDSKKIAAESKKRPKKPSKSAKKPKRELAESSQSKGNPKPQIFIAVASVLIVGVLAAWSLGLFSSGSSNDDNVTDGDNGTSQDDDGDSTDKTKTGLLKDEIKVGNEGDFKRISEAISYIQEHAREYTADTLPKIVVSPGEEFIDQISIDNSDFTFPKGVEIICEGNRPALLKSDGTRPALSLMGVEGFRVSGLRINAAGAETAIELAGYCTGLKLEALKISGFKKAGIQTEGVVGLPSKQVRIEKCSFTPTNSNAVGIIIADGSASPSDLQIVQCRFLGPLSVGIQIAANSLNWLLVQQSIFSETETAIVVSGKSPVLQEIKIANNSFFQCNTGIHLKSAPGFGSSGLGFYQNLFAEHRGAELLFNSKQDRDSLVKALSHKNRGFHLNWTSRSAPKNETEFDLFANGGKKNASALKFKSTNKTDPGFLKPLDSKLKLNSAPNGNNLRFIGAISP